MGNALTVSVLELEKDHLKRPRRRGKDNIKVDFKVIGLDGTLLVLSMEMCRAVVDMAKNLPAPCNVGEFLTGQGYVNF